MASQGPTDPVSALTYALSLPTDSPEQAHALKTLRHIFEAQPAAIPQFCITLLQNAVAGKDSLFKRFVIELFCFALGTGGLSLDVRTQREPFRFFLFLLNLRENPSLEMDASERRWIWMTRTACVYM